MKVTVVINGSKQLILVPENKEEKDLIALFDGLKSTYEIKIMNENTQLLDTPVTGALLIKEIKQNTEKEILKG